MDLVEMQRLQAEFDAKHWSHAPGFETIRHVSHHIGKLMGKIATYCEAMEHGEDASLEQMRDEVIPDLAIFAARLANDPLFKIQLGDAFLARCESLERRFTAKGP